MDKYIFLFLFLLLHSPSQAQFILEWEEDYDLRLRDFRSDQSEVNPRLASIAFSSGTNLDFAFHMSSAEFMFTKNFNSEVTAEFSPESAVIAAPDTASAMDLLNFGRYSFDLTELYARKFRKEIYEQKKAFSKVDFFQAIYDKLQAQMATEHARVMKETELGSRREVLEKERAAVRQQIRELPDFCKECKPGKGKK
jgi:hypothetical protein